jgi:hypothetical protein
MADHLSDTEFLVLLTSASRDYLATVDTWEAAYQRFYRLASPQQMSSDLEPEYRAHLAARRRLQELVPRARRLCRRNGLRDPWAGILHIRLGDRTPQTGRITAVGQAERGLITRCLVELETSIRVPPGEDTSKSIPSAHRGVLGRILDYFF